MPRRWAKACVLVAVIVAAGGVVYGRYIAPARRAAEDARDAIASALASSDARHDPVLRVPKSPGPITLDGDTDDPGWVRDPGPAKTGPFLLDEGTPAVPYSQARLVWSGDYLYVALFASDEDIESRVNRPDAPVGDDDDAIHVVFTQGNVEYALDVSPNAFVTDRKRTGGGAWDASWNSGARASKELGGTVNDPRNVDEEWEIELAIPLASLGLDGDAARAIGVSFRRCDTPKESPRVCAGWPASGVGGTGRALLVLQ